MLGYRDSGMPDSPSTTPTPAASPGPARRGRRPAGRRSSGGSGRRSSSPTATTRRATRTPTTCGCTRSRWPPSTPRPTPTAYPEAGEPWQVAKVYWSVWSRKRMVAMHDAFLSSGSSRPSTTSGSPASRRTTASPPASTSTGSTHVRTAALRAHATQIDPDVAVLVRPARRGRRQDPPLRGLHPGPVDRSTPRARGRPLRRPALTVPVDVPCIHLPRR